MLTTQQLKEQLKHTLDTTDFPRLGKKYEGKVRDNYTHGNKRIIITTDRISAFDRVLCTLPFKGQVLNQMAVFWFEKTKQIVKNHLIDSPDPNVSIVHECKPFPIEFIVRGYITGVTSTSAWTNYSKGVRNLCGNIMPEGLKKDQKFETSILTPSTKAELGAHDENISREDIIKHKLMSQEDFDKVREIAFKLFELGQKIAAKQGIILVDTKYEFGKLDGEIVLMDEIHTPDSSRFWFADTYQELFNAGREQRKIDKEYIRTWLADHGFKGEGDVPEIPDEIKIEASRRYIEAFELITGQKFNTEVGDINKRIEMNLKNKGYL
ncbi:TPA: phosphoribosylaminoimidazolesuccinocarboxamide synthase [Candidatus Woesearchaeota archaeon]|nr:phosphoribosylaminoimidazolesuccinocarboxamide synthase [Candidatus Woesearchaeota archaeon]